MRFSSHPAWNRSHPAAEPDPLYPAAVSIPASTTGDPASDAAGKDTTNRAPLPGSDSTNARPPCASAIAGHDREPEPGAAARRASATGRPGRTARTTRAACVLRQPRARGRRPRARARPSSTLDADARRRARRRVRPRRSRAGCRAPGAGGRRRRTDSPPVSRERERTRPAPSRGPRRRRRAPARARSTGVALERPALVEPREQQQVVDQQAHAAPTRAGCPAIARSRSSGRSRAPRSNSSA